MKPTDCMVKILFILFLLLTSVRCHAQSKIYTPKGQLIADTVFSISRKQLNEFIKIEDSLIQFIIKNIHYPEIERENKITEDFIIQFTTGKKGEVVDFKNIKETKQWTNLEKEAIRTVKNFPTGILPGQYTFPLAFSFSIGNAGLTLLQDGYIQVKTTTPKRVDTKTF